MCDPNLLSNTKSVLRYLIKNGPEIQTIDSLSLNFFNYTSVPIPFFELGYRFLLTFLRSIPDILQIDPETFHVRPPGTFQSISPNGSQGMQLRMTYDVPPVSALTQPFPEEINESTSTISGLGPRRDGDGKCSSLDSIPSNNEIESHQKCEEDQSVLVSNNDAKNDVDVDADVITSKKRTKKKSVRFACTWLNDEPFEEETKTNLNDVCGNLQKSLSLSLDDTAPSDKSDYDVKDSPEAKVPIPPADDAIPMFDDEINLLSSRFFCGEFGCTIETTNIDDIVKVGCVYELYVSEVNSPFKFWFQFNEDVPNPVEELQEHLNGTYQMTDCIPPLIEPEDMKKGYVCAVMYANMWHRGEIIGSVEDKKVGIFFVDYGTVDQVEIRYVRYLLNSFCALPKLCHRGTLDFIKPRNTAQRWTIEATTFLISLVQDKKLSAGITEIDSKNNSVRMYLVNSEENVNVNCSMIHNWFAWPEDPRDRYQNHIADVVPSFDELEKGQYPSFTTVAQLLEQNYDYEEQLHNSIVEEFDFHIPLYISEDEAKERMEKFMKRKEDGQKRAKKRDAKVFLEMFHNILKNPFLNPILVNEIACNATNPFLD